MSNELGLETFNQNILMDYFRTYLFKVTIGTDSEFQCQWIANTQTPIVNTSAQIIDFMHSQIKQGGRTIPQQWQITVRDDADGKAFKYFNDWRMIIYPETTNSLPSRYKKTINVEMISPKLETNIRRYGIYGAWPMEIGNIQLDYESDAISTFPVTLSFDFYKIEGVQ